MRILRQLFDPEVKLKELDQWYAAKIKSYENTLLPFGDVVRSVQFGRKKRATDLMKDVAPEAFPPEKSLAAAELYCHAELVQRKILAAQRFLTSMPDAAHRYQAQQLLLQGYERLADAEGIQAVLREIKPPSGHDALVLINRASGFQVPIVAKKQGVSAALDMLRLVERLAPLPALLKDEKEGALADNVVANLALARANLLWELGRKAEAQQVLKDAYRQVRRPMDRARLESAGKKQGLKLSPTGTP